MENNSLIDKIITFVKSKYFYRVFYILLSLAIIVLLCKPCTIKTGKGEIMTDKPGFITK